MQTYLNLTVRKLKVLSKLQLNFLKTVSSHLNPYVENFPGNLGAMFQVEANFLGQRSVAGDSPNRL